MALPINSSTSNRPNTSDSRSTSYLKNARRRFNNRNKTVSVGQSLAGTYKNEDSFTSFVPSNVTITSEGNYSIGGGGGSSGKSPVVNGQTLELLKPSEAPQSVQKNEPQNPSGNYVSQMVNGKQFVSFVPKNVSINAIKFFNDTQGKPLGESNPLRQQSVLYPQSKRFDLQRGFVGTGLVYGEAGFFQSGLKGTTTRQGSVFETQRAGVDFVTSKDVIPFVFSPVKGAYKSADYLLFEKPKDFLPAFSFAEVDKRNSVKKNFANDVDVKNFNALSGDVRDFGVSVVKGAGKAGYFFSDVTLQSIGGQKFRNEVLPSFSFAEVDRRKNTGFIVPSRVFPTGQQVENAVFKKENDFSLVDKNFNRNLGALKTFTGDRDVQNAFFTGLTFGAEGALTVLGSRGGNYLATSIAGDKLLKTGFFFLGAQQVGEGFTNKDYGKIGLGSLAIAGSGGEPFRTAKRPFLELVSERVPAEDIFSVYSQKPLSGGSADAMFKAFEEGKLNVKFQEKNIYEQVTISPEPYKEYKSNYVRMGAGPKGLAGIEDAGGFFGPKASGNLMFSGIKGTASSTEYSLNPFASLFGGKPTATLLYSKGFINLPREVLGEAGFTFSNPKILKYINENVKGSGFTYFSKRGLLGKDYGLTPQFFRVSEDIQLKSVRYEKGQLVREAGTGEFEVISVPDNILRRKVRSDDLLINRVFGYRKFTRVGAFRLGDVGFGSYKVENVNLGFGKLGKLEVPLTGEFVRVPEYNLLSAVSFGKRSSSGILNVDVVESTKKSKRDSGDSGLSSGSSEVINIKFNPLSSSSKGFDSLKSFTSLPRNNLSSLKANNESSFYSSNKSLSSNSLLISNSNTSSNSKSRNSSNNSLVSSINNSSSNSSFNSSIKSLLSSPRSNKSNNSSLRSLKSSRSKTSSSRSITSYVPDISTSNLYKRGKKEENIGKGLYTSKKKSYKIKDTGLYALPDLRSVNITEAQTGKEATTPLLRGKTKFDVYKAFKGLSSGFIPTREIQLKRVKV